MEPEIQASLVTQLCCIQRWSLELYQAAWGWRAPDRHQVVSVDGKVGVTHILAALCLILVVNH